MPKPNTDSDASAASAKQRKSKKSSKKSKAKASSETEEEPSVPDVVNTDTEAEGDAPAAQAEGNSTDTDVPTTNAKAGDNGASNSDTEQLATGSSCESDASVVPAKNKKLDRFKVKTAPPPKQAPVANYFDKEMAKLTRKQASGIENQADTVLFILHSLNQYTVRSEDFLRADIVSLLQAYDISTEKCIRLYETALEYVQSSPFLKNIEPPYIVLTDGEYKLIAEVVDVVRADQLKLTGQQMEFCSVHSGIAYPLEVVVEFAAHATGAELSMLRVLASPDAPFTSLEALQAALPACDCVAELYSEMSKYDLNMYTRIVRPLTGMSYFDKRLCLDPTGDTTEYGLVPHALLMFRQYFFILGDSDHATFLSAYVRKQTAALQDVKIDGMSVLSYFQANNSHSVPIHERKVDNICWFNKHGHVYVAMRAFNSGSPGTFLHQAATADQNLFNYSIIYGTNVVSQRVRAVEDVMAAELAKHQGTMVVSRDDRKTYSYKGSFNTLQAESHAEVLSRPRKFDQMVDGEMVSVTHYSSIPAFFDTMEVMHDRVRSIIVHTAVGGPIKIASLYEKFKSEYADLNVSAENLDAVVESLCNTIIGHNPNPIFNLEDSVLYTHNAIVHYVKRDKIDKYAHVKQAFTGNMFRFDLFFVLTEQLGVADIIKNMQADLIAVRMQTNITSSMITIITTILIKYFKYNNATNHMNMDIRSIAQALRVLDFDFVTDAVTTAVANLELNVKDFLSANNIPYNHRVAAVYTAIAARVVYENSIKDGTSGFFPLQLLPAQLCAAFAMLASNTDMHVHYSVCENNEVRVAACTWPELFKLNGRMLV